jgi:DNA recombination-dependent growth factor C
MAILKGSFSVSRYKFLCEAKITLAKLNPLLGTFQAGPLRLDGSRKLEKAAWICPIDRQSDGLGDHDPWDMSDAQTGNGLFLKMRIERRKIPNSLLQYVYRNRVLAQAKKKKRALTRAEQKELREELEQELLMKILPTLTFCQAFWNTENQTVYLFSGANRAKVLFEKLFTQTFAEPLQGQLMAVQPPLMGLDFNLGRTKPETTLAISRIEATLPISGF